MGEICLMISVYDLIAWSMEHAIGRSASYPKGWICASDLMQLAKMVELVHPLAFEYSLISNVQNDNKV